MTRQGPDLDGSGRISRWMVGVCGPSEVPLHPVFAARAAIVRQWGTFQAGGRLEAIAVVLSLLLGAIICLAALVLSLVLALRRGNERQERLVAEITERKQQEQEQQHRIDKLQRECRQLEDEHDRLQARHMTLRLQHEQLATEHEDLRCERDGLESQRDRLLIDHHQLESLLDRLPHLIFFKDAEGRFVRVSRSLAHLAGRTRPQDLIGATACELFDGPLAAEWAAALPESPSDGSALGQMCRLTAPDGSVRWFGVSAMVMQDGDGAPGGWMGIGTDVTGIQEALEVACRHREVARLKQRELELRHGRSLEGLEELLDDPRAASDPLLLRVAERIGWMKFVHELLLSGSDAAQPLTQIVRSIAPVSPPVSVRSEGDDVIIPAPLVAPFAAIVHHLTMSSLEAGALSVAQGRVRVTWEIGPEAEDARRLCFQWHELPGAMIEPKPLSEETVCLIQDLLCGLLGGAVQFSGNGQGNGHRIQLPLDAPARLSLARTVDAQARRPAGNGTSAVGRIGPAPRWSEVAGSSRTAR